MSVTIETVQAAGPNQVMVRWSSDLTNPLYRIWRGGVRIDVTRRNWGVFALDGGDARDIVIADDSAVPSGTAEKHAVLLWDAVAATAAYRVEQSIDAAWVTLHEVADDGRQLYQWRTPLLPAGTATSFRVTPIGTNGNDGTPVTPTVTLAGQPDPPEVAATYDLGTMTISAV